MGKRRKRKGGILNAFFRLLIYLLCVIVMTIIVQYMIGFVYEKICHIRFEHKNTSYAEEYTIAENMEILQRIDPEVWATCSKEEKLEFVQTVANVEANYLGIPKPLPVKVYDLSGNTVGQYHQKEYEIHIDESYLYDSDVNQDGLKETSVLDIVKTICHEAYHAYQRELVNAYQSMDDTYQNLRLFLPVSEYLENFNAYNDPKDNYQEYYNQKIEKDAREYAEDAVMDYIIENLDFTRKTS